MFWPYRTPPPPGNSRPFCEGSVDIFWDCTICNTVMIPAGRLLHMCSEQLLLTTDFIYVLKEGNYRSWNLILFVKHFPCFCYRCYAAWDYILQLSKDTSDNQIMSENVLYIIEEICSSSQGKMPPGVKEIVQQFTKSEFFKSIFPIFVENTAKGSCYRY